jgi:hypothetical protein
LPLFQKKKEKKLYYYHDFSILFRTSHDEKITILLESSEYNTSIVVFFVRFADLHLICRENHMQAEYQRLFCIFALLKLKQKQCQPILFLLYLSFFLRFRLHLSYRSSSLCCFPKAKYLKDISDSLISLLSVNQLYGPGKLFLITYTFDSSFDLFFLFSK